MEVLYHVREPNGVCGHQGSKGCMYAGDATVAIATGRVLVDTNFEGRCLLGRAEVVKGRKNDFNRVLAGMNIDLDWAMFEQT